jgi:hypothetical protein
MLNSQASLRRMAKVKAESKRHQDQRAKSMRS